LTPQKPLIQRIVSRTAALFGVRFYNLLYGEKSLLEKIETVIPAPEVRVDPARNEDIDNLLRQLSPEQERYCSAAREIGSECWIAWHDEQIVGYSWLNRQQVNLLGWQLFKLPDSGAYTYNGNSIWSSSRRRC
jgi:hypothetical protein